MSASLLRRAATLAVAFIGLALCVAAPTATAAPAPGAATASSASALRADWTEYQVTRYSGNNCGWATFWYRYRLQDNGYYYIEILNGKFGWDSTRATCGTWGQPYSVVLEWKGKTDHCCIGSFDWEPFRFGTEPSDPFRDLSDGGYKDLRFKVCNMNNTTSFIGTCGPD